MDNLKYKKSFLIIAYGILVQFFILPYLEFPMIKAEDVTSYVVAKIFLVASLLSLIFCLHRKKLIKQWVIFFHSFCFLYILIGQYFNPGYHFAAIQYMFVSAIIFEGFSYVTTGFMLIFLLMYSLHPFSKTIYPDYPFYHGDVFNALISSWIVSVLLERYVNRVKNKQSMLDKKLRYKGIKTDLFMHDLKNKIQPIVAQNSNIKELQELVDAVRSFNSMSDVEELSFKSVVLAIKDKMALKQNALLTEMMTFLLIKWIFKRFFIIL